MRLLITLLLFMSLVVPAFAQEDSMPAYVLFKLTPGVDPTSEQQFQPGWPIAVRAQSQYGGKQVLPNFGQLVILDATVKQVEGAYMIPWHRAIDWEFVSHDWPADVHTLKVYVKEGVSASMKGALTRDEVESFLTKWGGEVLEILPNSVTFAVAVTDAIKSEGFLGMVPPAGVLSETAYNQSTGVHTMRIDYATIPLPLTRLQEIIVENGCTVTSHKPARKYALFTCGRDNVFSQFKLSVKQALDGQFSLRRWRLPAAAIQAIVNAGGSLEVTRAQVMDTIKNRLDD